MAWTFTLRTTHYGRPDDLRHLVDQAHANGIGVILDVVYNHLGPDGNYLSEFSQDYFTDRYENEWGRAINFDGPNSSPVREFFRSNASYWIDEFHMDGLRLDATQQIFDQSDDNIMAEIGREITAGGSRPQLFLVAENEPQDIRLALPVDKKGYGLDALWNDDFHHSATVALTGRREAYYTDYLGKSQEFVSMAKYGFLYQGQRYKWQGQRRGTPALRAKPSTFVNFIQNHDQVANSARGLRCHQLAEPGRVRAHDRTVAAAAANTDAVSRSGIRRFCAFPVLCRPQAGTGGASRAGRREFLQQFPSLASPEAQAMLKDPGDPKTFQKCKLDFSERRTHAGIYRLHRDLLRLRREDPVLSRRADQGIDGAVLSSEAFLLRFFSADDADRILLVNLGAEIRLDPAPEPLLAPPAAKSWELLLSSEDPAYDGHGTGPLESEENWVIPGMLRSCLARQRQTRRVADALKHFDVGRPNALTRSRTRTSSTSGSLQTDWVATLPARSMAR